MHLFTVDGVTYDSQNRPVIDGVAPEAPEEPYRFREKRGEGLIDNIFAENENEGDKDDDFEPPSDNEDGQYDGESDSDADNTKPRKRMKTSKAGGGHKNTTQPASSTVNGERGSLAQLSQGALNQQRQQGGQGSLSGNPAICSSCRSQSLQCSYSVDGKMPCSNCQKSTSKCIDLRKAHLEANLAANISKPRQTSSRIDNRSQLPEAIDPALEIKSQKCYQCRDRPFCSLESSPGDTCTKCKSEAKPCTLGPPITAPNKPKTVQSRIGSITNPVPRPPLAKIPKNATPLPVAPIPEDEVPLLSSPQDMREFEKAVNKLDRQHAAEERRTKEQRAAKKNVSKGAKRQRKTSAAKRAPHKTRPKQPKQTQKSQKASTKVSYRFKQSKKRSHKPRVREHQSKSSSEKCVSIFEGNAINSDQEDESDTTLTSIDMEIWDLTDSADTTEIRIPTRYPFPIHFDQNTRGQPIQCNFCTDLPEGTAMMWQLWGREPSEAIIMKQKWGSTTKESGYDGEHETVMCSDCTARRFGILQCDPHNMVPIADLSRLHLEDLPAEILLELDENMAPQLREPLQVCDICTYPANYECHSSAQNGCCQEKNELPEETEADAPIVEVQAVENEKFKEETFNDSHSKGSKKLGVALGARFDTLGLNLPAFTFIYENPARLSLAFGEEPLSDNDGVTTPNPSPTNTGAITDITEADLTNKQFEINNEDFLKQNAPQDITIDKNELLDHTSSPTPPLSDGGAASKTESAPEELPEASSEKTSDPVVAAVDVSEASSEFVTKTEPVQEKPETSYSHEMIMSVSPPIPPEVVQSKAPGLDMQKKQLQTCAPVAFMYGTITHKNTFRMAPFDGPSDTPPSHNPDIMMDDLMDEVSNFGIQDERTSSSRGLFLSDDEDDPMEDDDAASRYESEDTPMDDNDDEANDLPAVEADQQSSHPPCRLKLCKHCTATLQSGKTIHQLIMELQEAEEKNLDNARPLRADSIFLRQDGIFVEWVRARIAAARRSRRK